MTRSNFFSSIGTALGYICGGGPGDDRLLEMLNTLQGSSRERYRQAILAYISEAGGDSDIAGNADYEYTWLPVSPPTNGAYADWDQWTGIVVVREQSRRLYDVLGAGYWIAAPYSEWMTFEEAAEVWQQRADVAAAADAFTVAQAAWTPGAADIEFELSLASNMFGKLDPVVKARIIACYANPTQATWDDAYSIIIDGSGMMNTLWSAVSAVDPTFPQSCAADGGRDRWPRVPSKELLRAALEFSTR